MALRIRFPIALSLCSAVKCNYIRKLCLQMDIWTCHLDIICLYMGIHSVIKSCWVIRCINLWKNSLYDDKLSLRIDISHLGNDIFLSGVTETVSVLIIRQWTHFLAMKTKFISEILGFCLKVIQLITWENFTTFSHCEYFQLYTLNWHTGHAILSKM